MGGYLNNTIEEQRLKHGLTQKELGEILGVADSVVSRYEKGELTPPYDKIRKMASIFHMDPEVLIGGESKRKYAYTDDGELIVKIGHGQVVRSELMSRTNEIAVSIMPDGAKFTSACVRKWIDTRFIHLVVLEKEKLLVIRKSDEDEVDSRKWSYLCGEKIMPRKVTGRDFAELVYSLMNWSKGYSHKIKGIPGVCEEDRSEKIWVFDLTEAEASPLTKKTRIKSGVKDKDLDPVSLATLERIEKEKNEEKKERNRLKNEGEILGPMKKYVYKPDKWGQYTFGYPVNMHENVRTVSLKT